MVASCGRETVKYRGNTKLGNIVTVKYRGNNKLGNIVLEILGMCHRSYHRKAIALCCLLFCLYSIHQANMMSRVE